MNVDVGIVGGGVAGSALAHVLSRTGVRVALVEREAEFRDRIRGEAIHPWGTREVDRLGLRSLILKRASGLELPIWQTYRNRAKLDPIVWTTIHPSIPPVLSIRHRELQTALIKTAGESGAHVFRPATVELSRDDRGPVMTVLQDGVTTTISARLIVGADGSHSVTRSWLGGEAKRDPIHHYMAGTLVSGLNLDPGAAHHASAPGGFSMIFPQTDGSFRLYFVCLPEERETFKGASQPQAILDGAARYFPERLVGDWKPLGPTGFFPNADIVSTVSSGPEAVLIGDAAGANDPSLGHGLSLVFRDVRELSELLIQQSDWAGIPAEFGSRRSTYYTVLREHAKWVAAITTEIGPEADALRAQVARAREIDPAAGGFAGIFALGPDRMVADEAARRHFLGYDLLP